jgi:hypothetical protein
VLPEVPTSYSAWMARNVCRAQDFKYPWFTPGFSEGLEAIIRKIVSVVEQADTGSAMHQDRSAGLIQP